MDCPSPRWFDTWEDELECSTSVNLFDEEIARYDATNSTERPLKPILPAVYDREITFFPHLMIEGGFVGENRPIRALLEAYDSPECHAHFRSDVGTRLTKEPPSAMRDRFNNVIESEQDYDDRCLLASTREGFLATIMVIELDVYDQYKPLSDEWFYYASTKIWEYCMIHSKPLPNFVTQSKSGGVHMYFIIDPLDDPGDFEKRYKELFKKFQNLKIVDSLGTKVMHMDEKTLQWTRLFNCPRAVFTARKNGVLVTKDKTRAPVHCWHHKELKTTNWKIKAEPEPVYYQRMAMPAEKVAVAREWLKERDVAVSGAGGSGWTCGTILALIEKFRLNADQLLEAIQDWNERCDPPWTEMELVKKIEWSERKAYGDVR